MADQPEQAPATPEQVLAWLRLFHAGLLVNIQTAEDQRKTRDMLIGAAGILISAIETMQRLPEPRVTVPNINVPGAIGHG